MRFFEQCGVETLDLCGQPIRGARVFRDEVDVSSFVVRVACVRVADVEVGWGSWRLTWSQKEKWNEIICQCAQRRLPGHYAQNLRAPAHAQLVTNLGKRLHKR